MTLISLGTDESLTFYALGNKLDGHSNGQGDSTDVAKRGLIILGDKRVFSVQILLCMC